MNWIISEPSFPRKVSYQETRGFGCWWERSWKEGLKVGLSLLRMSKSLASSCDWQEREVTEGHLKLT